MDVIVVEPQLVWHRFQWWDVVATMLKLNPHKIPETSGPVVMFSELIINGMYSGHMSQQGVM
jgi:hypothetical protein